MSAVTKPSFATVIARYVFLVINCGFYGTRRNAGLALYLKMLVLVTTISVPNFTLVSKSAQFTKLPDYPKLATSDKSRLA